MNSRNPKFTKDCSGGFRCYRVSKLRQAHLERMISRGYSFQEEVLYRCHKARFRIGEALKSALN